MIAKTGAEKKTLREAGRRLALILKELEGALRPGVTTRELNELAERRIREEGDTPAFLGYQPAGSSFPYPATLCISVNDEIVHGIPGARVLADGDIVGLDLGLVHEGLIVDAARTGAVGAPSDEALHLMRETEHALAQGIKAVRPGGRIGDIGAAVEEVARKGNFGIVRELGGHGVGAKVHELPHIPNFGKPGTGPHIEEGMVLAIEPMFTSGKGDVEVLADGYTFASVDGSLGAHFEDTILVTERGAEILTRV